MFAAIEDFDVHYQFPAVSGSQLGNRCGKIEKLTIMDKLAINFTNTECKFCLRMCVAQQSMCSRELSRRIQISKVDSRMALV